MMDQRCSPPSSLPIPLRKSSVILNMPHKCSFRSGDWPVPVAANKKGCLP
jgi:hypothetical protein